MLVLVLKFCLLVVISLVIVYAIRHYVFTLSRLFGRQRHPYINIDNANWPTVTIMVAAHNEEAVIKFSLDALLKVHYPKEKLKVIVVNDRSTDDTRAIVDDYVARYPDYIVPFHREEGKPGKAAALKDATQFVKSEIIIVFDADYIPGRGLVKQLVAPFIDPEVGLVMGRVVPVNTGHNLLTRLLDLERAGGYQVDQQARMNLSLVPQYGGTVGGVRVSALNSVGGWLDDTLAEDTDLTYRAILRGWKSVYVNRSECYEEVPETWPVRVRQIKRWARGHNQSLFRYAGQCIFGGKAPLRSRLDGLLLLGVYIMSPVILIGWALAMTLFYLGENNLVIGSLALFAVASYGTVGNFAAFFEICAAAHLDKSGHRIRLLPLSFFNFLISMLAVSQATLAPVLSPSTKWHKTHRFRQANFVI